MGLVGLGVQAVLEEPGDWWWVSADLNRECVKSVLMYSDNNEGEA